MESIKEILLQIHKSQKKLRVKITVFLKKLEDALFKKREKLDGSAIRLLLIGAEKDISGLMQICGIRSKFKGSLKNSSYYCIKLLYRVFTEHPQKKDILQIFYDFDEDEFLAMKLASHIMSDKKNDEAGYNVARLIKEKRPHLNLKSYIQDRVAQEKFEEWMKQYKSGQVQRQINQKEWKDQEGEDSEQKEKMAPKISDEFRPSNVRKRDEKKLKKQKYFQEIHLSNFQQNVEYYKLTFQDPLLSILEEEDDLKKSKSTKNSNRQAALTKNQLKQVFNKRITKPEDIMKIINLNMDGGKVPQLDDVIAKIHVESPDFEPIAFLSLFHTKTPNDILEKAARQLEKEQSKGLTLNKSLVYYYLDQFLEVHKGVMKTHLNFIQIEAQSHGSYFNQIKAAQSRLEETVGQVSREMIQMKQDSGSMRQALNFLSKNELIITMPNQLKKHYNRNDFEKISKLFQQAFPYLKRYKGMKILQHVYIEIDRILQMSQDLVITQIEKNLDNRRKMTEYTNILLDLQYDYLDDSNNYNNNNSVIQQKSKIVVGKPIYSVEQKINDQKSSIIIQEENHNLLKMIKYLEQKLTENIQNNTNIVNSQETEIISKKQQAQSNTFIVEETGLASVNEQQERMKKLMLINSVLFESDRLTNFMQQNNVVSNSRQIKIKDIEAYFTENMSRFDNFYSLLYSYQNGEYDYKLPMKGGKAPNRNALKYFNSIFISLVKAAETSVQYLETNYDFIKIQQNKAQQKQYSEKNMSDSPKSEESTIKQNQQDEETNTNAIIRGKEDVIGCSNILFLLKQLGQKINLGGEQIKQLQEKTMRIAYIVSLQDLIQIKLQGYEFYSNLTITKTYINNDEFISPYSMFLYESLLESINYLTSLKIFRPHLDLFTLDKTFLTRAISLCFNYVSACISQEHKRLQQEEYEFSQSTGNYSYLTISNDQVLLIQLSNFISFSQYQVKLLLQQVYDQVLKQPQNKASQISEQQNNPEKIMNNQIKEIQKALDQSQGHLKQLLAQMKAQEILKECSDLFTPQVIKNTQQQQSNPRLSNASALAINEFQFDANMVYNISILQQLAPSGLDQSQQNLEISQNFQLEKYEIRYKMLDILSEFDQFIQQISMNCSQELVKELCQQLLEAILININQLINNSESLYTDVFMLKQIRIELEFLQESTTEIKTLRSQERFNVIYSTLKRIYQSRLTSMTNSQQLQNIEVDVGKLKEIIRNTKFKCKFNFRFFN